MTTSDLDLNPSRMQDEEILQVAFFSYEVKAEHTEKVADISITLATSKEKRLPDLVDEYM